MAEEAKVIESPAGKREALRAIGMNDVDIEFILATESGELPDGDLSVEDENE